MNPNTPSYQEAQSAMMACAELVQTPKPDWTNIRSRLEQFRSVEKFDGVSEEKSRTMISMIWAVLGDCYRESDQIHAAAEAYRLANQYQSQHPTGFAEYYAEMVLNHHLMDHYRCALESLQASHASWGRLPLLTRISGHLTSLVMCWRSGSLWHPMLGKRKALIRKLSQEVRELLRTEY